MRLWAWKFSSAETSGVGARIANLETLGEDTSEKRGDGLQVVEVGLPHGRMPVEDPGV